jgi:hypothetical protein
MNDGSSPSFCPLGHSTPAASSFPNHFGPISDLSSLPQPARSVGQSSLSKVPAPQCDFKATAEPVPQRSLGRRCSRCRRDASFASPPCGVADDQVGSQLRRFYSRRSLGPIFALRSVTMARSISACIFVKSAYDIFSKSPLRAIPWNSTDGAYCRRGTCAVRALITMGLE